MRVEAGVLEEHSIRSGLVTEKGQAVRRHGRAGARKRVPHLPRLSAVAAKNMQELKAGAAEIQQRTAVCACWLGYGIITGGGISPGLSSVADVGGSTAGIRWLYVI